MHATNTNQVGPRKLTKKAFRAWLQTKRPRAFVGEVASNTKCPIATFLQHTYNSKIGDWTVSDYKIDGLEQSYTAPHWVHLFINKVDVSMNYKVTANKCLQILDNLNTETGC